MAKVLRVHRRLSRSATGGRSDPRAARAHVPPRADGRLVLPEPGPCPAGLTETLLTRRSAYTFGPEQPSLVTLATWLRWAVGPQREARQGDGTSRTMAIAPSAGGLRSLTPYVVARGAGGLPSGVWRVGAGASALEAVRRGDPAPFLARALDQPEFAERATVVVALAARLDTTLAKYPARHYRTLHVDAGIALQNLLLVATALGLPTCAVMGFDDDAFDALLDLHGGAFTAVLVAAGGRVSGPGTGAGP